MVKQCEYCGKYILGKPAATWDGTLPYHKAPMHFDFCSELHFVKWYVEPDDEELAGINSIADRI